MNSEDSDENAIKTDIQFQWHIHEAFHNDTHNDDQNSRLLCIESVKFPNYFLRHRNADYMSFTMGEPAKILYVQH